MGSGLAALAGILGGFGQVPKSLEAMDVNEREQNRLGQQQSQFQQQQDRLTRSETTDLGAFYDVTGIPRPQGPTTVPTNLSGPMATALMSRQQKDLDRQRLTGLSDAVRASATTPGQLTQGPTPGDDEESAAFLPRTQTTTDPNMLALAKILPMMDPARAEAAVVDRFKIKTPEPFTLGAEQDRYDASGTLIASGRDKAPKEATGPQMTQQRIAAALRAKGYTEGTPAWDVAFYNAMRMVPVTEGGGILGGGDIIPPAPQPNMPTPPHNPRPMAMGPLKPPEAGERKDIAQFNTLVPLGDKILRQWEDDPSIKAGFMGRLGERELPFGARGSDLVGGALRPDQRTFLANKTELIGTYRQIKSGLAVTNPEISMGMPMVPKDAGAATYEQIAALQDWAKRNRMEIDRALAAANRSTGPAPLTTPPAPGVRKIRVTDGRRTGTIELQPGEPLPAGLRPAQ
jgi:hypothetical protein